MKGLNLLLITTLFLTATFFFSLFLSCRNKIKNFPPGIEATEKKASEPEPLIEAKYPMKQTAVINRSSDTINDIKRISLQQSGAERKDTDIQFLKASLLKKGIYFGSSLSPADIELRVPRPKNFLTEISKYFNFYTISVTYKITEPNHKGEFNFDATDKSIEFAIVNNAKIKAHTLVMGDPLPNWLIKGNYSPQELKDILKNHIQTIIRHCKEKYPGKVSIWNVVNEPACNGGVFTDPEICLDHGVEKNIWTAIHKPGSDDPTDYIQLAFEWAHEADPDAKLYLNEAGIEVETHPKVERAYQLVKYLKQKGISIDGVGIQGHVRLYDKEKFTSDGLINIMNRFADLGLETQISEFDVLLAKGNKRINHFTPTIQLAIENPENSDFVKQAEMYRLFLDACLHAKNCTGFTTWGPWDGASWANKHWTGKFYPHLLDDSLKPKLAFKYLMDEARAYNIEK